MVECDCVSQNGWKCFRKVSQRTIPGFASLLETEASSIQDRQGSVQVLAFLHHISRLQTRTFDQLFTTRTTRTEGSIAHEVEVVRI